MIYAKRGDERRLFNQWIWDNLPDHKYGWELTTDRPAPLPTPEKLQPVVDSSQPVKPRKQRRK